VEPFLILPLYFGGRLVARRRIRFSRRVCSACDSIERLQGDVQQPRGRNGHKAFHVSADGFCCGYSYGKSPKNAATTFAKKTCTQSAKARRYALYDAQ